MPAADTPLLENPAAASTQVAMATFDAALLCTYANDRFAEVAGLDDGALVGRSWTALFPGLPAGQQALVNAVAGTGPAVVEVDVTGTATGRPGAPVGARQRWRLVLHRVEGVPGVVRGRMLSVVGTLATGPAVLDPPAFRHRLDDTHPRRRGAAGSPARGPRSRSPRPVWPAAPPHCAVWCGPPTSSASTSTRPPAGPTWRCSAPTCRRPGPRPRSVTGCAGPRSSARDLPGTNCPR